MGADFYTDDYLQNGGGGGYYDGGGGGYDYYAGGSGGDVIDWGFDTTSWPTFDEYYGTDGGPVADQAWLIDSFDQIGTPDTTSLWQESYFDWLGTGLNPESAAYFADLDVEAAAGAGVIRIAGSEPGAPSVPTLPEIPAPADTYFPYYPYDYWQTPPYIPPFEPPAPPPPGIDLPPYCPVGTYHPISDPFACVPFPPTPPTTTRQPKPSAQQPAPAPSAPRPPTQQAPRQQQPCPTGHCKHPTTGQCVLIPQGYYRHPQTQVCTATTAQVSPLLPIPTEATDMFADLKKLPWWVWVAGAGLLLLGMGGEERKSVTIRHRRAD